jgi:hypothetical protein
MHWGINAALPHADQHPGRVLAHAPTDNDGLCHCELFSPVVEVLRGAREHPKAIKMRVTADLLDASPEPALETSMALVPLRAETSP